MDDFTPCGDKFEEAFDNMEKVLIKCIVTRICLSDEKCHMLMIGIALGNFIYSEGI